MHVKILKKPPEGDFLYSSIFFLFFYDKYPKGIGTAVARNGGTRLAG